MSIEETRERLGRRVRQVIDESDIAFSTAQRAQLPALVDGLTDAVLIEFDALLGTMMRSGQLNQPQAPERATPAAPVAPPGTFPQTPGVDTPEEILWEGRPFLSLGELYVVTSERIRLITGLVGREAEDIELIRVQDVDHHQGVGERILNIGDIYLRTADKSEGDLVLRNVTNPIEVHEIIRKAMLAARRKYPFAFRQEL